MYKRFLNKPFSSLPVFFLFLNIFGLSCELRAEKSGFNNHDLLAQDQRLSQEKDGLDLNKINSSVDAGAFYSIELSITQLEENSAKMAQDLKHLKEQVEFAKQMEQKRLEQIRKLEQDNAKLRQLWLDNSFDNSWSGTADKLENFENKSSEKPEASDNVYQGLTQNSTVQDSVITEPVQEKSSSDTSSQTESPQPMEARQDVVVDVTN